MFKVDHEDPRRIGFCHWQVGNYRTISKVAAFERANGDISKIKFHWMDDVWDSMDLKEPALSWQDLLKIRATQLRERFKHVALMYSGGWDSHTALMSFVDNNIKLDEIVIFNRPWVKDVEIAGARATAERVVAEYNLSTKLTEFEIPWDHHARVFEEAGEDYIYLPGMPLCFSKTNRIVLNEIAKTVIDVKKIHAPGTAVYIEAHDKPRVNLRDGKWYHFCIDNSMYSHMGRGSVELFFHSPDLPELELKQAYMSIRWFEDKMRQNLQLGPEFVHEIQSWKHPKLYGEYNIAMGRTCGFSYSAYHGLAKTFTDSTWFSPLRKEDKPLIIYTKSNNEKVYKIFEAGLRSMAEITKQDVNYMPGIMSKQRYLKDFERNKI